MKRKEVYAIIDGEREHQLIRYGQEGQEREVKNFAYHMQRHLDLAKEHVQEDGSDSQPALEELRKVVAIGIACFEQHGVPERKSQEDAEAV